MGLSFEEFKEYVQKREFQEKSRFYKRLIEVIEPYIEEKNIKCFYPRNVFNSDEKEFIFFLEKFIISVTFQKEEKYFVNCIPLKLETISLDIPEYINNGIVLRLKNEIGEEINLNSLEDSNKNWNDSYIESINGIYKFLIER